MNKETISRFIAWNTVIFFLITGPYTNIWAEIYTYIDKNGVRHFSNVPTGTEYRPYTSPYKSAGIFFPDRFDPYIYQASETHGVPFHLLKALIKVESDFDHRAVSPAGAMGLMQIMPANLEDLKIKNPYDPQENIMGGTRYLKSLLDRFDGKVSLALAAYNAGPSKVLQNNSIPPIRETRDYVEKVLKYYRIIKNRE